MARRRTIKTVNSEFINDAKTILDLINKHTFYLRTDTPHYAALSDLGSKLVETARRLHGEHLPWGQGSTGPVTAEQSDSSWYKRDGGSTAGSLEERHRR